MLKCDISEEYSKVLVSKLGWTLVFVEYIYFFIPILGERPQICIEIGP
jgi:hypothetical protein